MTMLKTMLCVAGLTLSSFAAGCGDSSSSTPAPPATPTPPSAPAAQAPATDFAAEAQKTIDQSNVKDELKKLEAEIDADTEE